MFFDKFDTLFGHYEGKLVNHNNALLAVGGRTTMGEERNASQLYWTYHPMSPIEGFWITRPRQVSGFTALSLENSLFIFGRLYLLE